MSFLLAYWDWLLLLIIAVGWRIEIWHERQRVAEDACVERGRRNLGRSCN